MVNDGNGCSVVLYYPVGGVIWRKSKFDSRSTLAIAPYEPLPMSYGQMCASNSRNTYSSQNKDISHRPFLSLPLFILIQYIYIVNGIYVIKYAIDFKKTSISIKSGNFQCSVKTKFYYIPFNEKKIRYPYFDHCKIQIEQGEQ